jgi:hypothetical protein
MRRFIRVSLLLVSVVVLGNPGLAFTRAQATDVSGIASPAQSRMVVFETFMRPG